MKNAFAESPLVRYVVRALVTMLVAGGAVTGTIWIDNPYVKVACAMIAALGAYLGIGYGTPVEPFVGINKVAVEVPAGTRTIPEAV